MILKYSIILDDYRTNNFLEITNVSLKMYKESIRKLTGFNL